MENIFSLQVCFAATYVTFLAGKEALFFYNEVHKAKRYAHPSIPSANVMECGDTFSFPAWALQTALTGRHGLQHSL